MSPTPKKILLLYISEDSGHHCASLAIERALHELDASIETLNINSFNYTNPILEKIINRAYMGVVRRTPELWDYLYDNPKVVKKTQTLRALIHRFNTGKLTSLLSECKPDCIVCTQAFPCGMVADFKKTHALRIPLVGVLTDYAPHSYWMYDSVDRYIVPSEETGHKLIDNGIDPARVLAYGIPIDTRFTQSVDRAAVCTRLGIDPSVPTILIMGGTQGLGPIKELVRSLDRVAFPLQIIVATGTNKKIFSWLKRHERSFHKKVVLFGFAQNIHELMAVATIIVTKPGGITTAEALARGLPMLIVHPLPGQEAMNTRFLLAEGVAVRAETPDDTAVLLEELLYNKSKLAHMGMRARQLSKPDSARRIAETILELAG